MFEINLKCYILCCKYTNIYRLKKNLVTLLNIPTSQEYSEYISLLTGNDMTDRCQFHCMHRIRATSVYYWHLPCTPCRYKHCISLYRRILHKALDYYHNGRNRHYCLSYRHYLKENCCLRGHCK